MASSTAQSLDQKLRRSLKKQPSNGKVVKEDGRRLRRSFLINDMVETLMHGCLEEQIEAAAIMQAMASISDGHRMALLSAGVLDALLRCIDLSGDLTMPYYALKAMADLSMNESVRQEFKRQGGLPHLLGILTMVVDNIKKTPRMKEQEPLLLVIRSATAALSAQSNNDQSKVVIREMKGINLFLNILTEFPEDEEIQLEVCSALANLSLDPASRFAIAKARGVEIMCQVLHYQPPAKVVLASLRALAHVSRLEEAINAFKEEDISAVVCCMNGNPDMEKNLWGCQVLCNLSGTSSLRTAALNAGAVDLLCNLLVSGCGQQRRATSWAVIALSNLSGLEKVKVAFRSQGAIGPTVKLLEIISSNLKDELLPPLLRLISNAATNTDCRVDICEADVHHIILRIIRSGEPALLRAALFALSTLCDHPPVGSLLCTGAMNVAMLLALLQNMDEISPLAACILAKCAKSEVGADALATDQVLSTVFYVVSNTRNEKAGAWAASCVNNVSRALGDRIIERSPDIVANILSILLKSTTIDITVWLLGALAEISKITPASRKGAEMIVEMNGITLMAQFLTTSTDGQVIEMAGSILRNLSDDHELRKEYNKQGAIRPLVNLLRVSQERNDLENTINAVRCMDAISVVQENGQAMRQSGAVPLLVKLLGNQVGSSFLDLESEAASTLANIGREDPGSLDIIRHAGAIPNLLSMLAVAVHGVNSYHIPRAARAAVDCLIVIAKGNETNRKAVLNSSNFHAVESLRKCDLDLESKELSDMVKPLLAALQLPDDWLAMGSSSVMKRRGGYKGPLPSRAKNAPPKPCVKTASKARDVLKFLIVDPKEDKEREEENSTAPSQHRVWSEDGENILDLVPKRELSVTIAAFPSNIKAARNFPSTIFESISRPVSGISGLFSHPIGDDWQSEDEHSQSDRQTNADEDDTSDFVIRDGQAFCVGG